MKIKEQLMLYPELSGEERVGVEEYVDAHPEWEPALNEAKRWDGLLSQVRRFAKDPIGDEVLAYCVVTRRMPIEQAPEEVADLIREIENRIAHDPALAARVAEMESRLSAAENASKPSDHFERLMQQPQGVQDADTTLASVQPSQAKSQEQAASRAPIDGHAGEDHGSEARRSRSPVHIWRVMAAVLAAVAVYGVLYAAGQLVRAPHERLAEFDRQELILEGFENVRGGDFADEPDASVVIYLDALDQLRSAERSFIGLFPRLDEARLDTAAALLKEVMSIEPAESFLSGEAAFLLGKTELARGNIDAASRAFSRVLVMGGRRAPDARRILVELGS